MSGWNFKAALKNEFKIWSISLFNVRLNISEVKGWCIFNLDLNVKPAIALIRGLDPRLYVSKCIYRVAVLYELNRRFPCGWSQSGSKQRNRRRADGVRGRAMQVPGQIEKVWERAGIYACSLSGATRVTDSSCWNSSLDSASGLTEKLYPGDKKLLVLITG